MSGFSAQWLDLREPVDHRSRNVELGRRLARHFEGWRPITVVDLGCGTGSNLRATAPLLGPDQSWTLVDYDQALLDAAGERLDRLGRRLRQAGQPPDPVQGRQAAQRRASAAPTSPAISTARSALPPTSSRRRPSSISSPPISSPASPPPWPGARPPSTPC